ncbi:glycosyltransferase family 4 protein [Superficieibacter sp. 1612_C1]|uniref:glycosyltransferase family 4 protein n=1 Tax=Superficieibacter sp. 1612_C1 TaxID=2780382 RepID=UPI001883B36E|nr:glycosyltransferase family 4 protein [Superficieibacter sp. 1612_C1]
MEKIIITANTGWYLYNFRRNTILSLVEKGFEVYAVAPNDDYTDRLQSLGCKFVNINMHRFSKNPIIELSVIFQYLRLYNRLKPTVILNFTPKSNIYSSISGGMLKIGIINNISGLGRMFINNNLAAKLVRMMYKFSQHHASTVFFQNKDDMNLFLEHNIVDNSQIDLVPGSGVDLDRFEHAPAPDDGIVRFILVARLLKEKGILDYILAASMIKDEYENVEFLLLGPVEKENIHSVSIDEIKKWENKGTIKYLGTTDDVPGKLRNVDCVVLPSYYREGVPKSLIEAAAMGKPIITTTNIGCRDTIENGITGYYCEMQNPKSVYEMMKEVIQCGHKKRVEMGLAGRDRAEKIFSEKIVINKYLNAINRIVVEKKKL